MIKSKVSDERLSTRSSFGINYARQGKLKRETSHNTVAVVIQNNRPSDFLLQYSFLPNFNQLFQNEYFVSRR